MRLLITGHSGFIGKHLIHALSQELVTDQLTSLITPNSYELDLLDSQAANQIIDFYQPTHVLHLAWARTDTDNYDLGNDHGVWADKTFALAQELSKSEITNWIVGTGLEARDNLNHLSPYGVAKAKLKHNVASFNNPFCRWISLPYVFSVFHQRPRLVLSCLQGAALLHPHIEQDFLEVRDVARQLASVIFEDRDQALSISSLVQTSNFKLCSQILKRKELVEFKSCSCLDSYNLDSDDSGTFFTSLLLL